MFIWQEIIDMRNKVLFFVIPCLLMTFSVFAQSDTENIYPALKLDLPLFDLPYQIDAMNTVGRGFFSSYANPSMAQSLAVSTDIISGFHYGMKVFHDKVNINETFKNIIFFGGTALIDFLFEYMPGGDGWTHEEYHRAVLTRFGADSFNGMNRFPIGASIVSVSQVRDEDLIRLKKENPYDFIRMHVAGIEGQYLLVNQLQRNNFFYDQKLLHEIEYWLITFNSHMYVMMSAQPENVDTNTETMNKNETDIPDRDFTGFDMTAWAYDIFRPLEPYEARGIHPLGNGINRYRTTKNLTDSELKYLKLQMGLQFFNYLSPMMFGIRTIKLGNEFEGNFAFRHYLTSFGADISANVFLKYRHFNMAFAYHSYVNYEHYFPAIEAELVDYPFNIGKFHMYLSPRILIGMQPKNQEFKTSSPEFLSFFGLRVDFNISKHILPYIDFTAKTKGWVAGNEYLKSSAGLQAGVSMRF